MNCVKRAVCSLLLGLTGLGGFAQESGTYNQYAAFNPNVFIGTQSPYRTASGVPASNYWQNQVNYSIQAKLDTLKARIAATIEIDYINNSPDSLSYVWLELGQNLFRKGSRGHWAQYVSTDAGGFHFSSVEIKTGDQWKKADYLVNDTRMQVRLPRAIVAKGGKQEFKMVYYFDMGNTQLRMGKVLTKNGTIFDLAQWYPRMCVYDDLRGWNVIPYLGAGEFYCEYGNFDYSITVPSNMIVAGAGELVNPDEVLTIAEQKRLAEARKSDLTKYIIAPDEVGTRKSRPIHKGSLTWHFKMKNSRDVAWSASAAFVWDAARINLPEGKTSLAMSVYPVESVGADAWTRSTEYLKKSVEFFSRNFYPFPYPVAVNVGGSADGMEYPGFCYCSWKIRNAHVLYFVTAHEIGHSWFPMLVGSDERRYAFMDEGFNTFIDVLAQDQFNHKEFGPKRDGEFDPMKKNPARDIAPFLASKNIESIATFADVVKGENAHPLYYYKSALGLVLVRNFITDSVRFNYAFRQYIKHWAFKHPAPEDFFRCMNNGLGEDLNWFWNGWYCQTWTLDQEVAGVSYNDQDPLNGADITLRNNGQLVMPVVLKITTVDGKEDQLRLPVEIWQRGAVYHLHYDSKVPLKSVIVDPDEQLPDTNPSNNLWKKN